LRSIEAHEVFETILRDRDAAIDVIERLRRARRTLENAARLLGPLAEHAAKLEAEVDPLDVYEYGSSQIVSEAQDAYNEAYDLLHGEKGGDRRG